MIGHGVVFTVFRHQRHRRSTNGGIPARSAGPWPAALGFDGSSVPGDDAAAQSGEASLYSRVERHPFGSNQ